MSSQDARLHGARSKISCTNCKARKKGCDYKKPSCTRCNRLGSDCHYQPRQYAFVEVTGCERTSGPSTTAGVTPSRLTSPKLLSNASLLATDYSQLLVEAFWSILLPIEEQGLDGSMGGLVSAPWVPVIRDIAAANSYVRQALEACAYAGLGWATEDNSLVRNATQPYLLALREVNKALRDPEQCRADEVLAACRLLSLFEMLRKLTSAEGPAMRLTGWQTHAAGAFQLLLLRGQERHMTVQGFQLYDGVRIMGVMQGMSQRRTNVFTRLGWQLPQYDLRDELFDIVCSVPELLEASDRLLGTCSDLSSHVVRENTLGEGCFLLERYLFVGQALKAWEERALALCQLSSGPDSRIHHSLLDECMSHGFAFFYACEQYWASCLAVYSSCQALFGRLQQLRMQDVSTVPALPSWMDPEPYMVYIVNTRLHFFEPQAGLWSAQGAVYPLSSTLIYLLRTGRRNSVEFTNVIDTLLNNKAGAVMADFIQMITAQG